MKLLKYENYIVSPSEEIFLVKAFRDLHNKDKSPDKEAFMQQLSIIYFMIDPRSPYQDIVDETERLETIKGENGMPDFELTADVVVAMDVYKKLTTTTSQKLLNSMRKAIAKIGEFLENVDLYKTDDKGKPVYTVASVVQATDKIPVLAKKLIETEKIVDSEITEIGRARGGNETKSLFEDGI